MNQQHKQIELETEVRAMIEQAKSAPEMWVDLPIWFRARIATLEVILTAEQGVES